MKRTIRRFASALFAGILVFGTLTTNFSMKAYAAPTTIAIENSHYDFTEKSKYEIDGATSTGKTTSPLGNLNLSGDMKSISAVNGFTAYEVQKDTVALNFAVQSTYSTTDEFQWHIIEDKSKDLNGEKTESNILKGAVVVQTSLTGDNWITDVVYTDIAGDKGTFSPDIYTSKPIQQVNGCYYRILVVYELERRVEDSHVGPITTKNYEKKKCAEVYTFYLIDSSENRADATLPDATPRRELGVKVNTGKDNGFSGNVAIDNKDPHFGWDIGTFFVNGYTRETADSTDNTPVFLKNLGDRVTLWFNLTQDINALNGNSKLVISEDKNAYDQQFEVPKSNFRHGTLIIRFTDHEGVAHDPVVYTDYLAACARTGANTKVELFEEGDYEVALDYEIEDKSGIGSSYSNYRIYFEFKIRNGNCMVFPFDNVTGAELNDGALTTNGFKLDMARSRYLTIDVERFVFKQSNGVFTPDSRFNRPAKDGDSYTDEGMYVFTVKNLYSGSNPTVKTIYVGDAAIYRALSSGYSLDEINSMIAEGGTLESDGSITMPVIEEPDPQVEEEIPSEEVVEEKPTIVETTQTETAVPVNQEVEETAQPEETASEDTAEEENSHKGGGAVIVIFAVLVAAAVCGFVVWKKKMPKKSSEEIEVSDNNENSNDGGDKS